MKQKKTNSYRKAQATASPSGDGGIAKMVRAPQTLNSGT